MDLVRILVSGPARWANHHALLDLCDALNEHAYVYGNVNVGDDGVLRRRIAEVLRLVASTREYQLA